MTTNIDPDDLSGIFYYFYTMKLEDISGIIGRHLLPIILLIIVLSQFVPYAADSGDELSDSGAPLGGLFQGNGVVMIIIMAFFMLKILAHAYLSKHPDA